MCDARSKLEAEAYFKWMKGSLKFELSLWTEAAENLKKAQLVYESLVQALPEEEQFIYRAKVDDLTPSLRYCAYNMGGNASMDELLQIRGHGLLQDLDTLVTQTKNQSLETLQTTEWRGRKINVRPERVRLFLISIQDLKQTINKSPSNQAKIEIIENVLIDCKDAISAVKDEIKQDPKLRLTSEDGVVHGIQYLLTYLSYIRLNLTLERNLYLVGQAKSSLDIQDNAAQNGGKQEGKKVRPQDISRFYEIILHNISEMQQLPGMETDKTYAEEMYALQLAFKAFRCYYIALTLINLKRWKEAVTMYERSTNYVLQASKLSKYINHQFNLEIELNQLIEHIEESKFSTHAFSVLQNDVVEDANLYGKSLKSSKSLFNSLKEYREDSLLNSRNPNVFKLTPEIQAVTCKPLFFDLAWNLVEFPSLHDKVQQVDAKKGITGLVKGFLGWGGPK